MEKKTKRLFFAAVLFTAAFLILTTLLFIVDVRPVAAGGTEIGFAGLNTKFFDLLGGYHATWYDLTEWCGYLAFAVAGAFALLGLWQWIKRKDLRKVDLDIYILAGLYIFVIGAYVGFEIFPLNYRPVLIGEEPSASFPSSHTMTVVSVMVSAIWQLRRRISSRPLRITLCTLAGVIAVYTVVGRTISGAHWLTDIIGGLFYSAAVLCWYAFFVKRFVKPKAETETE